MRKILLLAVLLVTSFSMMRAQDQPLPIDTKVKYGKLENGLTYYIRHNELPKERVEIHIAQNVGAVLEEDDQNGLAHFLEHMCFNGTENFPSNGVIKYCESIGVKFGVDLNAYTSYDQTVYRLSNVPTTRETIIDSCLLIIHDWAGALLLEEDEINKERGVIREEMRGYGGADWRMMEKILEEIVPDNRYGKRNIIGTEEVIMNFKPQTLRDYYHKWYRPDLQAVIVVGDIDVDAMEGKIKAIFSDLKMPANVAERTEFPVADNAEVLVGIATDKEATVPTVSIDFKHETMPKELKGTITGLISDYFDGIANRIMTERFRDMTQQANPPFVAAYAYNGNFANTRTAEAWQGTTYIKDNEVELGFKALVREMERVNRHGFTAGEYERAKSNLLTYYETQYNERDKTMSVRYANEYIRHFTQGEYIPGIETEYEIINMLAPNIPVEAINEYIMQLMSEDENIVIYYQGPDAKDGVAAPTKDQMLKWLKEVQAEKIDPIVETVSDEPLMTELPKGGKVVKEEKNNIFDATVYTLSNGVKVMIKTTDLKDDEILMAATSPGGSSHFPESDSINVKLYSNVAALGGVGNFSATNLTKALAGKRVNVSLTMELTEEGMQGNSNVKDFETMLQLIYLNFTAPRMDMDAYQSFVARMKSQLEAMEANPEMEFYYRMPEALYKNPARFSQLRAADMDMVNYQAIMDWRKERYADASDFTFTFVGNIKPEEAKNMIALYLGSLPSTNRKESFVPVNIDFNSGIKDNHFSKAMDNPKAIVLDFFWTTVENTQYNKVVMNYLSQILTTVYLEKIREDEGGTYSIGAYGGISEYPSGRTAMQIMFETEPGKEAYLNGIALKEFDELASNGPREEDFAKVKEYLVKQFADQQQQNSYWRNVMNYYNGYGKDNYTNYLNIVNTVTPDDVQKMAKQIIGAGNKIEVIMTGIKE